jgi:thymidylate synthase (FAD)
MRVDLISWPQTVFDESKHYEGWEDKDFVNAPYQPHLWSNEEPSDELAEFAGRACYESWDRPNPDTASNKGYLDNIIKRAHFSVVEHANFTIYITGVSRTLTHELVRHRHFSYSQKSQRYVDESNAQFIIPPVIRDLENASLRYSLLSSVESKMAQARSTYRYIYESLIAEGCSKKEARGAARSVLPGGTETSVVVTGNIRAWREFFGKRISDGADQEIRELGEVILDTIRPYAPNSLQDLNWGEDGS